MRAPETRAIAAAMGAHTIRAVAVASATDPRTVRKFIDGRPVSSMCAERIAEAMARLGFAVTASPAASGDTADEEETPK